MPSFKALRRSMKGDKGDAKVQHISITPKSAIAIVPPKKVIRALYDYEAQSSQELSFSRGDFFHVIGRENNEDWYEACNPALPDARGLVPVQFFQTLGRTERDSGQSEASTVSSKQAYHPDSGYSDNTGAVEALRSPDPIPRQTQQPQAQTKPTSKGTGAMVYGIVMYDFAAERPDELEAKAGEAIIVIAQSNPEWFVAKPIGRLGGPGLIPVSFIEIRDMGSGQAVPDAQEAVQRAGVPKVEEWKKMAADYKNSSITLGKFEVPTSQQQQALEKSMDRLSLQQQQGRQSSQANGQGLRTSQQNQQPQQPPQNFSHQRQTSQLYAPIAAQIPRFCFAEEKYWFVIEASLDNGSHWELSRFYEDFYDFQIALLREFPAEAGNTPQQKRTLPYMPGPVNYVTDAITDGRRHNLDAYVKNLLNQPPYISRCQLVKQFFAPREGDFEIDPNSRGADYRMSGQSRGSSEGSPGVVSQQSSQGNLNGNGYPGSAAPRQTHSRGQSSVSASGGGPQNPYRQENTLSQPATNSQQVGQQPPTSAMKVKISFGDDVIAIRVPTDVQYQELHDKIRDRLKIPGREEVVLSYKDEASGERPALMSNNDLDIALSRNDKLMIYVD